MGKKVKSKVIMPAGQFYSLTDELTPREEEFFAMVEKCDILSVQTFLETNRININLKNYQGITPLHLAIQNDCETLVELFLQQRGVKIGDSVLFAIAHDNVKLLDQLMEYSSKHRDDRTDDINVETDDAVVEDDSDEFPPSMTPLLLAAQCGRYETVEYLLNRGHKVDAPHPPRCVCEERCKPAAVRANVVADGCERLNAYRAISDPTYVCCTSPKDPILQCFRLHNELLDCGDVDQVYKTVYTAMAQQVRQFAVEMIVNCRTSDEVKLLLRNRDGCLFRGQFPYPRLITAMDHKQKEFVAHTNIQQVLETAWIGDWIEWKAYSSFRRCMYVFWRFVCMPFTVMLGVIAPESALNRSNRLPINRMFNWLVTYLVFLTMLFLQSNADKFTMRRGIPDTVVWLPIAVFVLGHVVEKIRLRLLQGPERYFRNMWNSYDTVKLSLFVIAYVCWVVAAFQAGWADCELDRKYWHWADPQLVAEGLFAIATVMAYMRLLFLCQLNYYIGPMQVSLGKVLYDFGKFAAFLVIIMAAFTCGLGTLYGYYAGMVSKDPETGEVTRQEDSFVTVADTFKTLFWGIFCMTTLEAPNVVVENTPGTFGQETQQHQFTQLVGYGLFAAFEVLMVIVMLNMLIAAMSDTFQRVADNAEYEWLFGRTKVYINFMLLSDMPPPFNLLPNAQMFTYLGRRVLKSGHGRQPLGDDPIKGDDNNDNNDSDRIEFCLLTAELIKRYFTHKAQLDRYF